MSENEMFMEVFTNFQSRFKGLEIVGTLVYYNGELQFNTEGFNLLYNLTKLCELLKDELQ